jgi:serine/threonine-protein kinase
MEQLLHYRLAGKIGEGGMGVVYKAYDERLARTVAIKVLPADASADPDRKARFMNEARAASALNHPNIVTIHDIASDSCADFMVMELIEGHTLADRIAAGQVAPSDALRWGIQIADAFAKAHAAGIIHRDLKPANVMLTPDGIVKVMDFGLAKLTDAAHSLDDNTITVKTQAGAIMGTMSYMSPEQAQGQKVDARSDIFAFGSVMYEVLTGRRAFGSHSGVSTMVAVVIEEPEPLGKTRSDLPPGLELVVTRCLRKNPEHRFPSMTDVRAALEAVQSGLTDSGARVPAIVETPSIAVLPFANLSGDKDNDYFSDGLSEEIINALTKAEGLRVIARTSAFRFRGEQDLRKLGATLNVRNVLEGSVRKAGNRIRVTAQLVNVNDESPLWSERYDRELEDVFAIQDDISQSIVEALKLKLAPRAPVTTVRTPANVEAYTLCLRGFYHLLHLTEEGFRKGHECFLEAHALEPNYALAHTGFARRFLFLAIMGAAPPVEALRQGKAAALRALELDDSLADVHCDLASCLGYLDRDWKQAEQHFQRALEMNPGSALVRTSYAATHLAPRGRLEEATATLQRAVELDPVSPLAHVSLGNTFSGRGMLEESLKHFQRALDLDPYYPLAHQGRAVAQYATGASEAGVESARLAVEYSGRNARAMGIYANLLAREGKTEAAKVVLSEMETASQQRYIPGFSLAFACLGLGQIDRAFSYLEQAVEMADPMVFLCRESKFWGPVQRDPRFAGLMKKLNLE